MNELRDLHNQLMSVVVGDRPLGEASDKGFSRCGRRVPEIRALLKDPLVKDIQRRRDALDVWNYVFLNTPSYEAASLALYAHQHRALTKTEFSKLKGWIERCDCWEHSDDLSKIYAETLEAQPEWVLPTLQKWNRARNPWKRRQSLVSLLEYAQKRKRVLPYEQLISLVLPLLADSEYYVQKGVGWTLREIYNVYPKETLAFFESEFADIDPIAWSAAVEKLDKGVRATLNEKRKKARLNK